MESATNDPNVPNIGGSVPAAPPPDIGAEIDRVRAEMLRHFERNDYTSPAVRRLEDINQSLSWARGDFCASPYDRAARQEGWDGNEATGYSVETVGEIADAPVAPCKDPD